MNFIIILVNIIVLTLFFILFHKRTNKLLYKYFEFNKKEILNFNTHIGNIENRIKREIKVKNVKSNILNNFSKENWIIITSFNRGELITKLIDSIKKYEKNIKIIVIDNGSENFTLEKLLNLKKAKSIDYLLLNENNLIPQWQKSYSLVQALKLLELREIDLITVSDDDITINSSWLETSTNLFNTFDDVKLVNLMDDDFQEQIHKTVENRTIDNLSFKVKETFNGAFFCIKFDTLVKLGYPPINEGISDSSVEDWYYSRLFKANNWKVAALNFSNHLGYNNSKREAIN